MSRFWARALLAFTTGLFLACAAAVSGGCWRRTPTCDGWRMTALYAVKDLGDRGVMMPPGVILRVERDTIWSLEPNCK